MTRLFFVGGFLGAGKTTLLYEITRMLKNQGKHVGLITNDQAADLADTALLRHKEVNIAEVSGSCFCCSFEDLRKAINKVGQNRKSDVIIAEPLGSCTDLSATLIHPLRDMMKSEIAVGPLTVLTDPDKLKDIVEGGTAGLHPGAAYIYRKQLEESDMILISKSDLYSRDEIKSLSGKLKELFPECPVIPVSARTGEGLEDWLNYVMEAEDAGERMLDIDYDRYAEGEAVLGWLNCSATLSGRDVDWDAFARKLMQNLSEEFDRIHAPVGHVKMILENGDQYTSANLTGHADTLHFRWLAGRGNNAEMIMNARVEMPPEKLETTFLNSLDRAAHDHITTRINRIRSISPAYPEPTHRYKKK